jgi:hypothetical protein
MQNPFTAEIELRRGDFFARARKSRIRNETFWFGELFYAYKEFFDGGRGKWEKHFEAC